MTRDILIAVAWNLCFALVLTLAYVVGRIDGAWEAPVRQRVRDVEGGRL